MSKQMKNLLFSIIILNSISKGNLKLEETNYDLVISTQQSRDCFLWKDTTFALYTNLSNQFDFFDPLDIDKQIIETSIRFKKNITAINFKCHLWKPRGEVLGAICDLKDDPKMINYYSDYSLDDYILTYKNKKIKFIFDLYFSILRKTPFLYSDVQTIDITDEKDDYYFKFRTGLFYETPVFLRDLDLFHLFFIPIDYCEVKERIMTCKMSRKKIESFLWQNPNYGRYSVANFNRDYGVKLSYLVFTIHIIKKIELQRKKNVYIEIKKIISKQVEEGTYIAYETNVTNISSIETRSYTFDFKSFSDKYEHKPQCLFKKNEDDTPLMLLCYIEFDQNVTAKMKRFISISIDYLSYIYNFTVSYPNEENFTVKGTGAYVVGKYPDILDFSLKDELNFTIYGRSLYKNDKLTLNPKSDNLKCQYSGFEIYQCIVPKSHFKGEKSGYYYLHYTNSLGGKSIYYEVTPFKVILSSNIISCKFSRIAFILILLLFI